MLDLLTVHKDRCFPFRSMRENETQTKELPTEEVSVQSLKRKHREVCCASIIDLSIRQCYTHIQF